MATFAASLGTRLVVTLGERGAALVRTDGAVDVVPPSPQVDAVDTTGAGDAFVAAFAVGIASGFDELVAVRMGCAIAADSVRWPGTQSSFPDPARCRELVADIVSGPRAVTPHASLGDQAEPA
jgi:ribokinase